MTRARRNFLWLFLAAMLATRALVPSGWMPVADADGTRIEICTGQGLIVATIGADGKLHKGEPEKRGTNHPCPYGTLAHALDVPELPALAAAPAPLAEAPAALQPPALAARLHAPRPPTRGPPQLA